MADSEDESRLPAGDLEDDGGDERMMWNWYFGQEAEGHDDEDDEWGDRNEHEEEDEEYEDPDYIPEEEEEEDEQYHDADDGEGEIDVEIFIGTDGNGDGDEEVELANEHATQRIMGLIRTLIRNRDLGNVLFEDAEDDDEGMLWGRRRRRARAEPVRYPKVPSEKGSELMYSGVFGANEHRVTKRKHLARRILDRELGIGNIHDRRRNQDMMAQGLIPSTNPEMIIHYGAPVYSGQFSDDGNFFYACGHDFKVRMYDTSNPYDWKYYKTVNYPWGQWTLTDASLSPDNRWLAYTSIQSNVCLAPTDPNDTGDPYTLDLAERSGQRTIQGWQIRDSFGIFSVRFSGDGRELVAGTSANSIVVYDIESRRVLHNVIGHSKDVNAVCFADKTSPHILYSGSDDATIKVWDRRSMGDGREAGAFVGHIEGLTYIDSKGDGRYVLSNGKDQMMKLWDLRMVMSTDRFNELNPTQHTQDSEFDYRWGSFGPDDWFPHPNDNSLVTFRGHKVLRTLIRCHFSPSSSTNSRYVYSGSQDGKVYIYNMDATVAGIIDVKQASKSQGSLDQRRRINREHDFRNWSTCVRDVSWHPNAPLLVASAWNGFNMLRGTCTLHSYNEADEDEAEPEMGRHVDERLRVTDPGYIDGS